jgi:sugar phosphate isomerase/epimerase
LDSAAFFDRYAVSTWLYVSYPLDEALRRIGGAGFRWVEIWADGSHLDPRLGVDLGDLRRLLDDLGLRVYSVHTPFTRLDLGDPTQGDPAEWRRLLGASIEHAGALGAVAAVVHTSSYASALAPGLEAASRQSTRDLIADLVEVAQAHRTRVALENLPGRGFWRLGTSVVELAAEFPDPRIGFCLDTGHSAINGVDPVAEARAAGRRLLSLHAANNDGKSDLHYVPTEGVVDWGRLEEALAGMGYAGRLVLETAGHGDVDGALARLSKLWQELPS